MNVEFIVRFDKELTAEQKRERKEAQQLHKMVNPNDYEGPVYEKEYEYLPITLPITDKVIFNVYDKNHTTVYIPKIATYMLKIKYDDFKQVFGIATGNLLIPKAESLIPPTP
jgi:hypothetical protein